MCYSKKYMLITKPAQYQYYGPQVAGHGLKQEHMGDGLKSVTSGQFRLGCTGPLGKTRLAILSPYPFSFWAVKIAQINLRWQIANKNSPRVTGSLMPGQIGSEIFKPNSFSSATTIHVPFIYIYIYL